MYHPAYSISATMLGPVHIRSQVGHLIVMLLYFQIKCSYGEILQFCSLLQLGSYCTLICCGPLESDHIIDTSIELSVP